MIFKKAGWMSALACLLIILSSSCLYAADRRTPVVEAVAKAGSAVVNIRTEQVISRTGSRLFGFGGGLFDEFFRQFAEPRSYTTESLGSGMIFEPRGMVLTNAHVIARASKIFIALPDEKKEIEAELVGADERLDLAVLKLPERGGGYPHVKFAKPDDLLLGETVIAIGNPLGFGSSITTGIISGPLRRLQLGDAIVSQFVQTDALINPGNSGGPLINLDGEVVGINTAIIKQAQGIGFAVPAGVVLRTVQEIIDHGRIRPAFFGIIPGSTGRAFVTERGSGGALVTDVEAPSPAEQAGIRLADVILKIDSVPVETPEEFFQLLTTYPPGSTVAVEILRGMKPLELKVDLKPFPAGFAFDYAERTFGFRVTETGRGLLVDHVYPGSAADKVGLHRGDLLAEVAGARLTTLDVYRNQVEANFGRLPLKFIFVRDREAYLIELP